METRKIKINGIELSLQRVNLRGWTKLDVARKAMEDAVYKKDFDRYFYAIVQFIETASFSEYPIDWGTIAWYDTYSVFSEVVSINTPTIDFPVLRGSNKDDGKLPWEYDGRTWFFWLNLFAKSYGWTENQIECLDIDTALGLYQEIMISEQLNREWDWGLSEIAYPYNSSTKTSEFKPLERPDWMKPIIPKSLPIVKMRKDMLPVGKIIDLSANKNGS